MSLSALIDPCLSVPTGMSHGVLRSPNGAVLWHLHGASPWCPPLSQLYPEGRPLLSPHCCASRSKTALLEGLEVDQYMLGILIYIQR